MRLRYICLFIVGFNVSMMAQKPGKVFDNNVFSAMDAKDQAQANTQHLFPVNIL